MTGDRPTTPGWHCHRCRSTSPEDLSTACRQRHPDHVVRVEYRPLLLSAYPAFECILAVVPPPLVSISETAGGHEGRWECQPLPTMPNKTQPSMGGICYLGNFLGDCHVRRVPRLRGLSRRESGGTTRVRWRGASYLGPSLPLCAVWIQMSSARTAPKTVAGVGGRGDCI